MSFLAALLNQDVDLDKSLVICFIFCDLEQILSDVTESGLNARSWLHQTHFANFTSCLSFWPAVQVAGGFIFADIGQCKNIKNKTIL